MRLLRKRRGPGICPAKMLLNGLTRKCSSEHRRGHGTLQRKVGKRLERRRGRTSGAAERQRDVADIEAAETPGEGTAGAPAQGHH